MYEKDEGRLLPIFIQSELEGTPFFRQNFVWHVRGPLVASLLMIWNLLPDTITFLKDEDF